MFEFLSKILTSDYKQKKIKRSDVNYSHYKAQRKELRKRSVNSYAFQELIDIVKNSPYLHDAEEQLFNINQKVLYKSYKHGINHNERVSLYTFVLANLLNLKKEDLKLALYAAMYHDIGRINDCEDTNHGKNSADKLDSLNLDVTEEELIILKTIITCHSLDDKKFDKICKENNIQDYDRCKTLFNILKDSDALDRTRLGWPRVRLEMLRIKHSLRLVKLSYEMFYNFKLMKKDEGLQIEECIKNTRKRYKNSKVKKIIEEQIKTFFEIEYSEFKLKRPTYEIGDDVVLNKNHYLHGISRNSRAVDFVAKNGIISKDAVTGEKGNHAFSFCSGFWRVKKEIPLKEYIINYSGMDVRYEDKNYLVPYGKLDEFVEKMKKENHWLWEAISSMEIRFMPSLARDINQYGFILNISSKEAKRLTKNDVNAKEYDKNIAKYFGVMFKEKDKEKIKQNTFANRASYVIFGMNKCFIEGVLVGRKVEKDENLLKELKEKFPECYICNLDGKVIK